MARARSQAAAAHATLEELAAGKGIDKDVATLRDELNREQLGVERRIADAVSLHLTMEPCVLRTRRA